MSGFGWNDYNPPLNGTNSGSRPAAGSDERADTMADTRRPSTSKARLLIAAVLVALASAAGVFAYFSSHGSGSASASVNSVQAPTNVVAKAANGSTTLGAAPITITWTPPNTGATPTAYRVVRDDGTTQTTLACTATPCSDSAAVNGTYTYHVKSLLGTSWTSATADSNSIQVQNQVSTTTTLISSGNPSVVGQTVTYTATVSAGAVVPGGTVDFKDGAATVCSTRPLTGSSPYTATCQQTYNATSAGHSITAVYSGDSATFGSTSSALSQAVNKAATTTSLISSVNPSVVGQQVTYTATVAVTAPGNATPTGTVTFKDGAASVCTTVAVTGSAPFTATCQQSYAAVNGGRSITAVYNTDAVTATSTSSAVIQVINKASTATSISSSVNPSVFGQSVTFTLSAAAVAPGAGTPTGTITVKEGTTTICTSGALSGGSGSCSTAALSVATHPLTATYNSDTNFSSSTSSTLNQVVNKASTTTAITSSVNPSVTGQSVTYTATVTATAPGSGTPSGTINFTDNGTTITGCGAKTLSGGQATCAVTYSASGGNHTQISGVYSGDTSFLTSTAPDFTQNVNKASTTTSLATSVTPAVFGQSITLTATVAAAAPGIGTPTGSVNFRDAGTTIPGCSAQTLSGGQATCATSALSTGTHSTITAVYSNDTNFNISTSANFTQTVNKASTTTSLASSNNTSVVGEQVTYTATIAPVAPGAGEPTGTVNFRDNGTTITGCGTQTLSGAQATCSITYAAPGSHTTITAVYSSDTNFSTSTSANFTQTVSKASTTTTLATSQTPSVFGQSVTLTATVAPVAPGAGTPTGTVNFRDNGTTIPGCSTQTLSGGQATCATSALSTGTHPTITAVYSSDANFNASTSANLTQTVNKASTTTSLATSKTPSVFGESITLTATVTAVAPGAGTPTGTVNFIDNGVTITGCATQTLSAGAAACTTSALTTGTHATITAVYSSDANFSTSTSNAFTQTVNKASTTTALASNLNPAVTGQNTTYTAAVAAVSPGAGTPTGTVSFTDGGSAITGCTNVSLSAGAATCTETSLTTGSHTIVATYAGDTNFTGSTSANFSESVNIFAGIDFVKSAPAGGTFSCTYTTITAVTCSLTGLGNGGATVSGTIRLVNASHTAVTNTGGAIPVSYSLANQASGLTPASPQSINNGASATPTISFTMNNGNNKTATLTASVVVNGATYTVTLTASS